MQGKPEIGLINVIAKALAESVEAKWDAKDFNETQNGETPDEQREYFRDLAIMAIQTGFPELCARLATYEAALRASKTALEECANLLRDRYPSVANKILGAHIAQIDKALGDTP